MQKLKVWGELFIVERVQTIVLLIKGKKGDPNKEVAK